MIPSYDIEVIPCLPRKATYWVPGEEDLTEEGIGFFRDTWLIMDVPFDDASYIICEEARLTSAAGRLTVNAQEFDRLASAIEYRDPDRLPESVANKPAFSEISDDISNEDFSPLEGIELGVSGLVHALAATGCFPAASCRGHVAPNAWSDRPVVLFAADRHRAKAIEPFVRNAGCGFTLDPHRPELLVIEAASIENTMNLANLILSHSDEITAVVPVLEMHEKTEFYVDANQSYLPGIWPPDKSEPPGCS